jgi:osmoprotectant transport system permease protein
VDLTELLANLPAYLGGHLLLSLSALVVGLAISLPLGIYASRHPKLAEWILAVASVIQTLPSLALLGLMVLMLGGLIGFWPAFLALVLYSMLPILANTVIGIRGVDAALTEAARGLGMNDRQMLWRVELPLATPVIIGGVRTATVLVVGTATLVTTVGGLSLGNYIFAGLAMLNHTATVFGCVAAALLAIVLDQLVRLLEVASRRRSKALGYGAVAGLLLVTAGGLYQPVAQAFTARNRVVISSTPFTEQYILSHVLANRLEAAGFQADQRDGMSSGIQMEALRRNQVDCCVVYTGDVWSLHMKEPGIADRDTTLARVTKYLNEDFGVVCLGPLGFDDSYALAVAPKTAQWGVTSIADLVRYQKFLGRPLVVGGDNQIFERSEWRSLKKEYGLSDKDVQIKAMDQSRMYDAVVEGQLDVIVAYTSDGHLKQFNLLLLDDPKHVFPPYDAILLVSREAYERPKLVACLRPLLGTINQPAIVEANRRVDLAGQSPKAVSQWLLWSIQPRRQRASLENHDILFHAQASRFPGFPVSFLDEQSLGNPPEGRHACLRAMPLSPSTLSSMSPSWRL